MPWLVNGFGWFAGIREQGLAPTKTQAISPVNGHFGLTFVDGLSCERSLLWEVAPAAERWLDGPGLILAVRRAHRAGRVALHADIGP